jgi:NAD-reducing hydrogenase large subunit
VASAHPDLARQGILMRKYGQEVIRLTAGKKIHGTGAIPGGINKNLAPEERDFLLEDLAQVLAWAQGAVQTAREHTLRHVEAMPDFGAVRSSHVSLVGTDGALELYDGVLRAVDAEGEAIFEGVDGHDYLDVLAEDVRSWTYMKFPFLRSIGPEDGWFRVGPLARMNTCGHIDTPLAEEARRAFMDLGDGKPVQATMAYHWARMIEVLHAVEKIAELLPDPDLQGEELVVTGEPRREAVAVLEAPRGTLLHHYKVDENDLVVRVNLIVSTTNNNEAMNRSVESVAREHLSGQEITEELLNHVEVAIRAYDPCLSCATHAVGRMPLVVDLVGPDGNLIARGAKDTG